MEARELMKQLEQDPEYQKMWARKEKEMEEKRKEIRIIEKPFIEFLHKNGFDQINSTDEIKSLKSVDAKLTDILLEWLPKLDNKHGSQEMLVRALCIAEEPFDGTLLMDLFDSKESSFNLKWVIGNTLASARRVEHITDWLEEKLSAAQPGKECEMLVYAAIKYFNYDKASTILRRLFPVFPLQVSDAFTRIGKIEDLIFLKENSIGYKGEQKTQINKAIKKLSAKV